MKDNRNKKVGSVAKILSRIGVYLVIILLLDFISGFFIIPENFHSFRTSHFYYHHGLLPNKDVLGAWGTQVYNVHTNSLGFMDSEVRKIPLQSENKRLLIIGDSHSEGVGVPFDKTFAGILADSMGEKGIEVLNASSISYSQKIEYLKAKYLLEKKNLEVDYIFVLVDISDLQNELVYENFNPELKFTSLRDVGLKLNSFMKNHFSIYYLVSSMKSSRNLKSFMETAELFDGYGNNSASRNTVELYSGFFSDFDDNTLLSNPQFHGVGSWYYNDFKELADRGMELGMENITKLKELCSENGIQLILSVHPWHTQIYKGDTEDYYVKKWKNFCTSEGIDFINLFPLFIDDSNAGLAIYRYYIMGDNHWNEFGHERVANYLNLRLDEIISE